MDDSTSIEIFEKKDLPQVLGLNEKQARLLEKVAAGLPQINKAREEFGRSGSEFSEETFSLFAHTPTRNMKHILARIEKSMGGLSESYFNRKELLQMPLTPRVQYELQKSRTFINGALKKVSNLIEAYESIKNKFDIGDLDEGKFEEQQVEEHVKEAFALAVRDFVARGFIDVGALQYGERLGISAREMVLEMRRYVEFDDTFDSYLDFLDEVYEKFKDRPAKESRRRGFSP